MFANSNLDALSEFIIYPISPILVDPGALFNFDFWKSAIFYISLVLTILWGLLVFWGWRKDLSDIKKQREQEELKDKGKESKAEDQNDEKLPVEVKQELFEEEPKEKGENNNSDDEDDEEYQKKKKKLKPRSVGRQFVNSLPVIEVMK